MSQDLYPNIRPPRMQRVAAEEFRGDNEKISGARLPIVTAPSGLESSVNGPRMRSPLQFLSRVKLHFSALPTEVRPRARR